MPNRILKESICTSENIDQLSAFVETVFYRLIVSVDDYGRIDARPKLLASKLFPLKDVRSAQIEDALRALTSAELVSTYTVDGKPFLQMNTWDRHQNIRAKKSKCPSPEDADEVNTSASNCMQMQANVPVIQSNPNPNTNPNPNPNTNNTPLPPQGEETPDVEELFGYNEFLLEAVKDWFTYKKQRKEKYQPVGMKSLLTMIQNNVGKYGEDAVVEVIRESMGSGYKGILWDKLKQQNNRQGKKPLSFADF